MLVDVVRQIEAKEERQARFEFLSQREEHQGSGMEPSDCYSVARLASRFKSIISKIYSLTMIFSEVSGLIL